MILSVTHKAVLLYVSDPIPFPFFFSLSTHKVKKKTPEAKYRDANDIFLFTILFLSQMTWSGGLTSTPECLGLLVHYETRSIIGI